MQSIPTKIVAPAGYVLRAYIYSTLCPSYKERALIDQWGLVLTQSSSGWSNQQGDYYRAVVLPEPVRMYDSFELWNYWYESKCWKNTAWAWMYYGRKTKG